MSATEIVLDSGIAMPAIGFGCYQIDDSDTATGMNTVIAHAAAVGYRAFDTASAYGNEAALGRALASCGVPREQLFVTTKVANEDQGYRSTLDAVRASADRLRLDYLDLVLVHWPAPRRGEYLQTWRALEQLHSAGFVRAIGVSNFQPAQLHRITEVATVTPAVNQIEVHPLLTQHALLDLHRRLGIRTQGLGAAGAGKAARSAGACHHRGPPRRHPRAGRAALAPADRHRAAAEILDAVADQREPRVRLPAGRNRHGRDHRPQPQPTNRTTPR